MHSFIKTALIAAAGVAVVSASPALAATKAKQDMRASQSYVGQTYVGQPYQGPVYGYAPGYEIQTPAPFWNDPGAGQIVLEYLKDTPIHNGNAY